MPKDIHMLILYCLIKSKGYLSHKPLRLNQIKVCKLGYLNTNKKIENYSNLVTKSQLKHKI